MLPITSLQNPTIKMIRSLADKKGRREHNLWVAEGFKMLERAMVLGWTPVHLIATKPVQLWEDVKPTLVSEKVMAELSAQNNPHEVLAAFRPWHERSLRAHDDGVYLALEEIRDPGNLGTILRTADAAGVTGVVLIGDCCDPYSPEAVRASTGSIFAFNPVLRSRETFVEMARGWNGAVVGLSQRASSDYRQRFRRPTLIVLGSEARGLSREVEAACTTLARIPIRDGVESLNVAAAAAVMMFEITGPVR
jgi:RNA methyltransferase, TrmH family